MRRGPLPAAVLAVLGLTLPGCSLLFVAKGETRYIPSSWKTPPASTSLAGEMEKNPPPQEAPASPAGKARHQVAPGDSLWKLAKHYYGKGAAYPKIASANGLDAEKPIRVGTWLTIFMPGQAEPLPPPGTSTPG
ncbi:MAG TPA: LysM peptidoglycan-binding domain-containing protein, partial [bacterium]|nr:LysM peptidoglycan-binding domain-containing protein [bacterium]